MLFEGLPLNRIHVSALFCSEPPAWQDLGRLSELNLCGDLGEEKPHTYSLPALRRLGIRASDIDECDYKLGQVVAPNLAHLYIWTIDGVTLFEDPFANRDLVTLLRKHYPRLKSVNGVDFPAGP